MGKQNLQIRFDTFNVLRVPFQSVNQNRKCLSVFNRSHNALIFGFNGGNLLFQTNLLICVFPNGISLLVAKFFDQFISSGIADDLIQNGIQHKGFQIITVYLLASAFTSLVVVCASVSEVFLFIAARKLSVACECMSALTTDNQTSQQVVFLFASASGSLFVFFLPLLGLFECMIIHDSGDTARNTDNLAVVLVAMRVAFTDCILSRAFVVGIDASILLVTDHIS